VKTRSGKIGYPLYCDAGPHEGDTRIDLAIRLYLSQEYASYEGPESLRITLGDPRSEPLPEPAGELPAGDVTAAGDVRLAARPQPAPPSGSAAPAAKEYRDGCP